MATKLKTIKECRKYLKKHGHFLSSSVNKSGHHKGQYLLGLKYAGFSYKTHRYIYPQTLRRWITRQLKDMEELVNGPE